MYKKSHVQNMNALKGLFRLFQYKPVEFVGLREDSLYLLDSKNDRLKTYEESIWVFFSYLVNQRYVFPVLPKETLMLRFVALFTFSFCKAPSRSSFQYISHLQKLFITHRSPTSRWYLKLVPNFCPNPKTNISTCSLIFSILLVFIKLFENLIGEK